MVFLWHVLLVLAAPTLVLSIDPNVQLECRKDSVKVTWKVDQALVDKPSRLLLGNCFPSKFSRTADGGGIAIFHYRLSECRFRQMKTKKHLVYKNVLAFRPLTGPSTTTTNYPIECVYERPAWIHPYVEPAFGALQGHGKLVFHMGLLNDDLSGPALSRIFTLGSFIYIWAAVEQQNHQPLMLHMDECVATNTAALGPESQIYPVITNKGCLVDGKSGHSRFLARSDPSSLVLRLQAFTFALNTEVYFHCKLTVWDPENLNEEKKSCNFNRDLGGWELLDDPSHNDLCRCCDYGCRKRKQSFHSEAKERVERHVLGPLVITSGSSNRDQSMF
ncbi:zona pellucida glycoprotein 3f, tandem duplicate 2 [Brachyhypopomus gauderio]|uniref:zona pellucida glycoprotein 3f, tandem duplicate 2 n=1 Tax=Brachyhypopomus gauderio TaxID=698409 RepID=UPI0040410722